MLREILEKCAGVNTRVDSKRQTLTPDKHLYIAEGVDVDIDDSGGVSRRCGRRILASNPGHSLFCDGGDGYVVQDHATWSSIYEVDTGLNLIGVRSGLTKGARVSFYRVGTKTYYSNGYENGVIENGVSTAWPDETVHYGATTSLVFRAAPLATHVAFFDSRWWLSVGKTIFVSEPRLPGKYDVFGKRFSFGTEVRMIRPVAGGVWVSDSEMTGFISKADELKGMTWVRKDTVPAHEWSDACRLYDYGRINIPGLSATWSSDAGQCIGTADGQLIVRTADTLVYPTGSYGATVVTDEAIINSIW